jgi:hypothetical protein
MADWSEWLLFPDPRNQGILVAPFGPGCYDLRNGNQAVTFGMGRNVAARMSSLLPPPLGCGTRNNEDKRDYIHLNLGNIEYRTLACKTLEEAAAEERTLKARRSHYRYQD